jgi:hypothetical protein
MTVDEIYPNSQIDPVAGSMHIFEVTLQHLSGARVLASLDSFLHFALHQKSQEIFSMLCHVGILTPNRLIQEVTNSADAF